ncbi:MAG: hypothetical protein OXH93_19470 [Caldilineaceae bacterium]|nr:hypothetical protein [Caldilineaceae bacterium]
MPPTTHPGAMLEIWSALSDILKARVFTNHGLYSVEQRVEHNLENALQEAWVEHIDTGIGRREIGDIDRWIRESHTSVTINAYADLFYHHAESSFGLIEVLLSTREILNTLVGIAKDKWADNDFAHFLGVPGWEILCGIPHGPTASVNPALNARAARWAQDLQIRARGDQDHGSQRQRCTATSTASPI